MSQFLSFSSSNESFSSLESAEIDLIDLPPIQEERYEDLSSSSDDCATPASNLSGRLDAQSTIQRLSAQIQELKQSSSSFSSALALSNDGNSSYDTDSSDVANTKTIKSQSDKKGVKEKEAEGTDDASKTITAEDGKVRADKNSASSGSSHSSLPAQDIEDILHSLERDAIGEEGVEVSASITPTTSNVGTDPDLEGSSNELTMENREHATEESIELVINETTDTADASRQASVAPTDIEDILAGLELDAMVPSNSTDEGQGESIIIEAITDNQNANHAAGDVTVITIENEDQNFVSGQNEDDLANLNAEVIDTDRSDEVSTDSATSSITSSVRDLVESGDIEAFLDDLESDAGYEAVTPTTSNVSDNESSVPTPTASNISESVDNTSTLNMEEEEFDESTNDHFKNRNEEDLVNEEGIEDILNFLEQDAIDSESHYSASSEDISREEQKYDTESEEDENNTIGTPPIINTAKKIKGTTSIISIEDVENEESGTENHNYKSPSTALDTEEIIQDNMNDQLSERKGNSNSEDLEDFLACLEEDSLNESMDSADARLTEIPQSTPGDDDEYHRIFVDEQPARVSLADDESQESPEDDTPREILIIAASTEECLDDYSSELNARDSYADGSFEGNIAEYDTILEETADTILPVATEEDVLFIKPSESEEAKETIQPSPPQILPEESIEDIRVVETQVKSSIPKKKVSYKVFDDKPTSTTFASAQARASRTNEVVTRKEGRKPSLPRKVRSSSKIHESLYKESCKQQEEGRKRRKQIEEKTSSCKGVGTRTGSSKSPTRHLRTRESSSKSPARRIHEDLYRESQALQEEGRRRRKEIENKLWSNRELRLRSSSSKSPVRVIRTRASTSKSPARKIHEDLYMESQARQEEGRRRRKEIEKKISLNKELRTRPSSSNSPARLIRTRPSTSRSPGKRIHESLYLESQAQQEEGRRRRKEIEKKISSNKELRTRQRLSPPKSLEDRKRLDRRKRRIQHRKTARSPRKIHEYLYNRSIAQQEEGRRRRKKVEEKLSSKINVTNCKSTHRKFKKIREKGEGSQQEIEQRQPSRQHSRNRNRGDDVREGVREAWSEGRQKNYQVEESPTNLLRHKRHMRQGIFQEEISKSKKKISINQAESLYERLMSHKSKTEEKTLNLRRVSEDREIQWLSETSQRKISVGKAIGIYYRGTVTSRSRSRGREGNDPY